VAWLNSCSYDQPPHPDAHPLAQGCPAGPTGAPSPLDAGEKLRACSGQKAALGGSTLGSALSTEEARASHWAPSHGLGCSS
jgi:hypothetical protein